MSPKKFEQGVTGVTDLSNVIKTYTIKKLSTKVKSNQVNFNHCSKHLASGIKQAIILDSDLGNKYKISLSVDIICRISLGFPSWCPTSL